MDGVNWKLIAQALYVAVLAHRADMHGRSNRPCETCRQSAAAIRAYDEAINEIARTNGNEVERLKVVLRTIQSEIDRQYREGHPNIGVIAGAVESVKTLLTKD